jgi:hypothetical protein
MTVIYVVTKHHFTNFDKNNKWCNDRPCDEYIIHSTYATKKEANIVAEKLDKRAKFYMFRVKRIALK